MAYLYEKYDKETMAVATGANLKISFKKSVETTREIRGKKIAQAIRFLEGVTEKKTVVPFRRFKAEMGHKKGAGIDTGGFPVTVAEELLRILKSAQKNASEKELGDNLYVLSASVTQGASRYRYGRFSGRKMKSTNVEIVVGGKTKN